MTRRLPQFDDPDLQSLAESVRELQKEWVRLERARASVRSDPLPRIIRQRTVVVIREPGENDSHLLVQEAGYASLPPEPPLPAGDDQDTIAANVAARNARDPNEPAPDPVLPEPPEPPEEEEPGPPYNWVGEPFIAFPDYGQTTAAYQGLVWDKEENPLPTVDSPFMRCRRENDAWIVELGLAGGIAFGILRGWAEDDEHTLYVQRLEKPADFTGVWTVSPDAPLQEVFTFGGLTAIEYVQHVWHVDELFDYTPVLPLVFDGQHWFALHAFKFLVGSFPPATNAYRMTDCHA